LHCLSESCRPRQPRGLRHETQSPPTVDYDQRGGYIWRSRIWHLLGSSRLYAQVATVNERLVGGYTMEFRIQPPRETSHHSSTGGTGIAVFNRLTHHAQKAGDDPTGLGHWSWLRLQGKDHRITRIVALYRPCCSDGPLSTYQQHCRALSKLSQNECPREAILCDLASEVKKWQDDGDSIILLTDFNEDIRQPWIQKFFADLQLMEVLTAITPLPPTTMHNRGTNPIDGIYVSPELVPSITGGTWLLRRSFRVTIERFG